MENDVRTVKVSHEGDRETKEKEQNPTNSNKRQSEMGEKKRKQRKWKIGESPLTAKGEKRRWGVEP